MKLWRELSSLAVLALIPAIMTGWLHPKHPEWSRTRIQVDQVELNDVLNWKSPVLWVDARATSTYQQKHIPEAVSLNESEWEQLLPGFLATWKPGVRVVVYCNTQECDASQAVAMRIKKELNLTEIYVLHGGWSSWEQNHH